ncbi:MAG TPA: serine hydrolase domain-containing protein [Acidimicrobiia bacterium]|nr:serine hydrolase domain-containing protein [Acidimicrobiia bacterium]
MSAPAPLIHGSVAPGWGGVADAFAANFTDRGDVGAACCVYHDGAAVVHLWAGLSDPTEDREWTENTIQLVFSATKGATAVCVHLLAQQEMLDLDEPITAVWPEFAAHGKDAITLRMVMCHRAGLAAIDGDLTLDDVLAGDAVTAAIAAQAPNWEPGTAQGYHVRSYGYIVGEVVRRVTGHSLGRFFADEVAGPLGLDFWIGLPEAQLPRVARVIPPDEPDDPDLRALVAEFFAGDSLTARAMSGPSRLFAYDEMWNDPHLLYAEMPSSNGVADARSVARMYAATLGEVDGVRLLDDDTLADATTEQSNERDLVIGLALRYGTGFALAPTIGLSAGPGAFGHSGAGGSVGMADLDTGFSLGYVMNRMELVETEGRADALIAAASRAASSV